jgi:hypothetical protein
MNRIFAILLLILVAGSVGGCVIEGPGGGWHHSHHWER